MSQNNTEQQLADLEIRIAYLEKHITEQDREILQWHHRWEQLKKELKQLKEKSNEGGNNADDPLSEKPPHY